MKNLPAHSSREKPLPRWVAHYAVDGEEEAWLAATSDAKSSWSATDRIEARHEFVFRHEAEAAIERYGGLVGGDWFAVKLGAAPLAKRNFKVIAVSIYLGDLDLVDSVVRDLRSRGLSHVNRSMVLRAAVRMASINALETELSDRL